MRGWVSTTILVAACSKQVPAEGGYPSDPPVVEYLRIGGQSGVERSDVRLWSDGTTQCTTGHDQRGHVPRANVDTMLRELDADGFFASSYREEAPQCPDAFYYTLIARKDGRQHTLDFSSCSPQTIQAFGDRVMKALDNKQCR